MAVLRWFGLVCLLVGWTACSSTPDKSALHPSKKPSGSPAVKISGSAINYVGLKIPPMPSKHETEMGYLLEPEGQGTYAIEVVNFGSKKIVWMGRLLYNDAKGKAHWKIVAALPPHPLPEGYHFSSGNCLSQGKPQPEIVAILKIEDKPKLTQIQKAWRANPEKEIFEELPLQGIYCINERWNRL